MGREQELTISSLLSSRYRLYFFPTGRDTAIGTAQQGIVTLDPRTRTPLARVLLHELIHVRRPMWKESKVLKEERRLWNRATWKDKAELYRALGRGRAVLESEELEDGIELQSGSQLEGPRAPDVDSPEGGRGGI